MLTQSEGGNDLIQCTTNLFNDQSQLARKACGGLSRCKGEFTSSVSRAGESLLDFGSSAGDG